jgi:pilus assembly protein CpaE
MTGVANLQPAPAAIHACTVSRDVLSFDQLIDDMEAEFGESWGDLSFDDALAFLGQNDAKALEFLAIAVDAQDEVRLAQICELIRAARVLSIRVVLVADHISPVLLHRLLQEGAQDFVPYPLPEGALHEAVRRAFTPAAKPVDLSAGGESGHKRHGHGTGTQGQHRGVVFPVHAMAGGLGASTFVTNIAWELVNLANSPARVCILDLDFQYGSVATYLDLPRKDAVFELLTDIAGADAEQFLAALLPFRDKLHVLTAPPDMLPLDIVGPEDIGKLIDMAQANFDFILIDMPKAIVAWTETVLARANMYFALLELDLRSAQNLLRLLRALRAEGLPDEKLRFVMNRAPKFTDLTAKSRVRRMAESLEINIDLNLPDGGVQVTQANDHGLPLSESYGRNILRKELQKLAKSLFDTTKAAEAVAR